MCLRPVVGVHSLRSVFGRLVSHRILNVTVTFRRNGVLKIHSPPVRLYYNVPTSGGPGQRVPRPHGAELPLQRCIGVVTGLCSLPRQATKAQYENHLGRDIGRNVYYFSIYGLPEERFV